MLRKFNHTFSLLVVLWLFNLAANAGMGQQSVYPTQQIQTSSPTVTAASSGERVRITAPASIIQMRVEVYDLNGAKVWDGDIRGNVFDWHLQDGQAQRLAAGEYTCVITIKDVAGRLTQKIGAVTVQEKDASVGIAGSAQLSAPQSQAIGPVEENSSWTVLTESENETTTVIAHNGTDGQLVRGRGAISFRFGDFFRGTDQEQMRLTEDGQLGIGTSTPQARLDVAGDIRARQGFVFGDGSRLNVSEKGTLTLTGSNGEKLPNVAGTGTSNRIVKWTDNAGTLGDSIITEANGGIGVNNPNPASLLHIGQFNGYGATTGLLLGNDLFGSTFDRSLQVAPVQVASPGFNSVLLYALPTINSGVTVPRQYGFFIDGKQGPGAVTSYAALATGQGPSLGASNNTHLLMGQLTIPTGNYGIYEATGSNNFFSGNVGIRATSPAFPLTFANTLGDKISLWSNGAASYGFGIQSSLLQVHTDISATDIAFGYGSSSSFAENMRIKGNGNVGIGTAPTERLEVAGNIKFSGIIYGDGSGLTNLPGGGGSFSWQNVTGPSVQAESNHGYNVDSDSQVTITLPGLPSGPNIGSIVRVAGVGTGGWKLVSNVSATIVGDKIALDGLTFTQRDSVRNWYSVASSANGVKLVAVAGNFPGDRIYTSTDSGVNWTPREAIRNWRAVASSADGVELVAAEAGGLIFRSIDSGVNWTALPSGIQNWSGLASSADGVKLVAVTFGGQVWTSADSGMNWIPRDFNRYWNSVASSASGEELIAVTYGGQIFISASSGVSWGPRENNRNWTGAAISSDGDKMVAVVDGGQIYVSNDYGVHWTPRESNRNWTAVASSADGNTLVASGIGETLAHKVLISTDAGLSWRLYALGSSNGEFFNSIALSADGGKIVGSTTAGRIYTANANVAPGLRGPQFSIIELEYIGSSRWFVLNRQGKLTAVNGFGF